MNFSAVDVARSKSATSIVFDSLRQAIVKGDLEEGAPLRQEEIANAFNTSRIPVREAIARLEQIGLVETRRFKGAVVAAIRVEDVDEIFDLRALVESDAIRRGIASMTETGKHRARACHEAFSGADDPLQWTDLNRQFHCSMYDAEHSPNYMGVINGLLDRLDRYLHAQLILTDGMEQATREHAAILGAYEAGDAELAAKLTREHVQGARVSLKNYLTAKRK